LSQTILDRYSLNELLKSNNKSHILDVDEEGAISVKKNNIFFIRRSEGHVTSKAQFQRFKMYY
jgi:hypothetical protein